ncbi:hypothetical protein NFA_3470 [Nocardia farcinica IFM 10152]|uniref:Uncharacterized protein n=1 Tax=Nocardia farcinica (strain IFM 10152) TaxID=247156 RepID=Q5Z302_NOCFA|nr:hypothetical protein NFA_3470 [Nocardia farcinica IFM 10152]
MGAAPRRGQLARATSSSPSRARRLRILAAAAGRPSSVSSFTSALLALSR